MPSYLPYTLLFILLSSAVLSNVAKKDLAHPTNIFFGLVAIYVPFKFFLVYFTPLEFEASNINQLDTSVDKAFFSSGSVLFVTFLLALLTRRMLRNIKFPIFKYQSNTNVAKVSIALILGLPVLFISLFGFDALFDGLKFRTFLMSNGMGYVYQLLNSIFLIALIQNLAEKHYFTSILLVSGALGFTVLSGMSGFLILTAIFVVMFFGYRDRIYGTSVVLPAIFLLPPLALIHGFIRAGGDIMHRLTMVFGGSTEQTFDFTRLGNEFISRVNQLESFTLLLEKIRMGTVELAPLSLLSIFFQAIPRAIWAEKPLFFNNEVMLLLHPWSEGLALTYNFLGMGELLYYFGYGGVVLGGVLIGAGVKYVEQAYERRDGDAGVFLFFSLTVFYFITSGFFVGWVNAPTIANILISLLVFLAFGKVSRIR